jgi:hypothetical protein
MCFSCSLTAKVAPSSPILVTLLVEAICSSETSVLTRATWHHIPEDDILHGHGHENFKSYRGLSSFSSNSNHSPFNLNNHLILHNIRYFCSWSRIFTLSTSQPISLHLRLLLFIYIFNLCHKTPSSYKQNRGKPPCILSSLLWWGGSPLFTEGINAAQSHIWHSHINCQNGSLSVFITKLLAHGAAPNCSMLIHHDILYSIVNSSSMPKAKGTTKYR